jgi:molecular chaperone GrpE
MEKNQNIQNNEVNQDVQADTENQEQSEENNDVSLTREQAQTLAFEIKKLREENSALQENIIREKAENDNLRKRHIRELDDTSKYIVGEFAKDLTEVMESLHRAQSFKSDFDGLTNADYSKITAEKIEQYATKVIAMFEGIDMTLKLLEKAFSGHGVNRLHPEGEEFDHRFHQAISQVAVDNKPHNSVVQVIQAGYSIKDRLLKPALVMVNNNTDKKSDNE